MEEFTDAELIQFMKTSFEGECKGDLDYLAQTSLEEVCRRNRYGESAGRILDEYEEKGDPENRRRWRRDEFASYFYEEEETE